MAYDDLRDAIVTVIQGVSGAGAVYDRERWSDDWAAFRNLFKVTIGSDQRIRGWTVSRTRKIHVIGEGAAYGKVTYENDFVIRGIMGFDDSADTEGTFQALVDSVLAALNGVRQLANQAVLYSTVPAEARVIDLRMFGQVLCHYVEIRYRPHVEEAHT